MLINAAKNKNSNQTNEHSHFSFYFFWISFSTDPIVVKFEFSVLAQCVFKCGSYHVSKQQNIQISKSNQTNEPSQFFFLLFWVFLSIFLNRLWVVENRKLSLVTLRYCTCYCSLTSIDWKVESTLKLSETINFVEVQQKLSRWTYKAGKQGGQAECTLVGKQIHDKVKKLMEQ